jgi:hypothetical protein
MCSALFFSSAFLILSVTQIAGLLDDEKEGTTARI